MLSTEKSRTGTDRKGAAGLGVIPNPVNSCYCEERSDEAISFGLLMGEIGSAEPFGVASLRSQ